MQIEFNYKKIYEENEPTSKRELALSKILVKPNFSGMYLWGKTNEGERTFHVERIQGDICDTEKKEFFSLENFLKRFGIDY